MNISTAGQIKELVLELTRRVDQSVQTALSRCDHDVAALYRQLAGDVMGLLFTNILMPIYREHLELEPPELRAAKKVVSSGIPLEVSAELIQLFTDLDEKVQKILELAQGSAGEIDRDPVFADVDEIFDAIRDARRFVEHNSQRSSAEPEGE